MNKEQSKAQANLAKLPAKCFGMLLGAPVGSRMIGLKAGMMGYTPMFEPVRWRSFTNDELEAEIDRMNTNDGVTKAQRTAMEIGSMQGWDVPGADCENEMVLELSGMKKAGAA